MSPINRVLGGSDFDLLFYFDFPFSSIEYQAQKQQQHQLYKRYLNFHYLTLYLRHVFKFSFWLSYYVLDKYSELCCWPKGLTSSCPIDIKATTTILLEFHVSFFLLLSQHDFLTCTAFDRLPLFAQFKVQLQNNISSSYM